MGIKIGNINADTSVKIGTTNVQNGYIGTNLIFGNQIVKILDAFGNAHHAYSLRKLSTPYIGACLRVRRTTSTPSVTTTTVDVSFDVNNEVSLNSAVTYVSGTATTAINLGQFCASVVNGYTNPDGVNTNQNIFVVTWFDQSGNNKNPTNATASQQPRLVSIGNLETSGGKVAVRFIRTSSTRLSINDTTANIDNMSSYYVGAFATTSTATQNVYSLGITFRYYLPVNVFGSIFAGYFNDNNAIFLNSQTTDRKLYELLAPAPSSPSQVVAYSNGVATGAVNLASGATTAISIGAAGGINAYDGFIQEIIGYQSNANREKKENNINTYWTIYP